MKKANTFLLMSYIILTPFLAKTQTIDYAYKPLSTESCNVFSTTTVVDNFEHLTALSRPIFTDNSIRLESKNVNTTTIQSTIYSIKYNFKAGYNYKISI